MFRSEINVRNSGCVALPLVPNVLMSTVKMKLLITGYSKVSNNVVLQGNTKFVFSVYYKCFFTPSDKINITFTLHFNNKISALQTCFLYFKTLCCFKQQQFFICLKVFAWKRPESLCQHIYNILVRKHTFKTVCKVISIYVHSLPQRNKCFQIFTTYLQICEHS